jgi:hypothetical protein
MHSLHRACGTSTAPTARGQQPRETRLGSADHVQLSPHSGRVPCGALDPLSARGRAQRRRGLACRPTPPPTSEPVSAVSSAGHLSLATNARRMLAATGLIEAVFAEHRRSSQGGHERRRPSDRTVLLSPNSAVRLRRTAPPARRSHSRRAIVPSAASRPCLCHGPSRRRLAAASPGCDTA